MKYEVSRQIRPLVVAAQGKGVEVSELYPVLNVIASVLQHIVSKHNLLITGKNEGEYQKLSQELISTLELIINDEITRPVFFNTIPEDYRSGGDVRQLRRLFEMDINEYRSINKWFQDKDETTVRQYMQVTKTVLSEHMRQIMMTLVKERSSPYLRNPLYLKAMADRKRRLRALKRRRIEQKAAGQGEHRIGQVPS